ncbi:MAG: hypothetical protein JST96_01820, partial [Bacteroidetes bacterium]|nr:hypothetical protein [Bacteroidota bacterium]
MKNTIIIIITAFVFCDVIAYAQITKPVLSERNLRVVNRDIAISAKNGKTVIHLNGKPNDGVAWINNLNFSTGTIELDIKGKNVVQQSFVGIAFHRSNDTMYDVIYFRPFNFQSTDTLRRKHAVQYVSLPKYDWSFLREAYPDRYENNLQHPPDPDQWIHATIKVGKNKIEVFVNKDNKP